MIICGIFPYWPFASFFDKKWSGETLMGIYLLFVSKSPELVVQSWPCLLPLKRATLSKSWSRRVGCRSFSKKTSKSGLRRVDYFKKAKKCGLALVHGSGAGMGSIPSGLGAPAPEVVGFSSASLPELKERSYPFPPVFSATEILGEKSSSPSSFEASNMSSSAVTSVSEGFGVFALVKSALGGDPPLSPSSEMAPSPALFGFDPALGDCSLGADALGERLRFSLPVMSESGAPIYPSESKSVLTYSRKNKVGKLDKHLLEEAFETFSSPKELSRPLCGVVSRPLSAPAKSSVAQDEGYQPILRHGFLLPSGVALPPSEVGVVPLSSVQSVLGCPPLMSFSEVGKSSRGGGFEEIGDPSEAAIDLSFCVNTLGISHEGNVKGFLDFMTLIDAEHRLEASISASKFKGSREVKNLECSINYDARGFGSSRGKAKRPNVMY
jgi:hypothetical protein